MEHDHDHDHSQGNNHDHSPLKEPGEGTSNLPPGSYILLALPLWAGRGSLLALILIITLVHALIV